MFTKERRQIQIEKLLYYLNFLSFNFFRFLFIFSVATIIIVSELLQNLIKLLIIVRFFLFDN
jgi:hypothetical protein